VNSITSQYNLYVVVKCQALIDGGCHCTYLLLTTPTNSKDTVTSRNVIEMTLSRLSRRLSGQRQWVCPERPRAYFIRLLMRRPTPVSPFPPVSAALKDLSKRLINQTIIALKMVSRQVASSMCYYNRVCLNG